MGPPLRQLKSHTFPSTAFGCCLPFKTFERHRHLSASRVADDKLLNARVDAVRGKEATRLRKLQAQVASPTKQMQLRTKTSPG